MAASLGQRTEHEESDVREKSEKWVVTGQGDTLWKITEHWESQ